jgi:hypothetical protein
VSNIWPEHDRKAWLKSVKVGDVVCVHIDTRGRESFTKATVERITPTGCFRVRKQGSDGLAKFPDDGAVKLGGTWGWYEYMRPWTKQVDEHIARLKLVHSVLFYLDRSVVDREVVEKLSDEDLKRLVMALRPLRKKDA